MVFLFSIKLLFSRNLNIEGEITGNVTINAQNSFDVTTKFESSLNIFYIENYQL